MSEPLFRVGADGIDETRVNEDCLRGRLDRLARGVIETGEAERIARLQLDIPVAPRSGSGRIVEALRLMQRSVSVDEPLPITSHRPVVGSLIVAVKKAVRRALRFETSDPWRRQAEFNRGVAVFAREVLGELGRIESESRSDGPSRVGGGVSQDRNGARGEGRGEE